MSLLDRGNTDALLFPEEAVTDRDGNVRTRASAVGVPVRVWVEPMGQSGTSARRAEQDNEGFESEQVLRMRVLRRDMDARIGAQAKVMIGNQVWSVFGDAVEYRGSARTRHVEYRLRRA